MNDVNKLAEAVIDACFKVHTRLGPGLLESIYETVLAYELEKSGLRALRQQPITVEYDGITFDEGFRADIVVENAIILELKSVEQVAQVHKKQLLTYLKLSDKRLGFLVNFGAAMMKDGITRIVNGL